jgi:hypothetical protein
LVTLKLKSPRVVAFVVVEFSAPVASFVSATLALGTELPEGSLMKPAIEP